MAEPGLAAHLRCRRKIQQNKWHNCYSFVLFLCGFDFFFRLFSASKEYLWLFLHRRRERGEGESVRESVSVYSNFVASHTWKSDYVKQLIYNSYSLTDISCDVNLFQYLRSAIMSTYECFLIIIFCFLFSFYLLE